MGRAYEDGVYVRVAGGAPEAFVWRERLYVVREVLSSWSVPVAWWQGSAARALRGDVSGSSALTPRAAAPAADEQVWRVSASVGYATEPGTYDLVCEPGGQRWSLAQVAD